MNITKIFTREEPVGGLEITETHLRAVLLTSKEDPETNPFLRFLNNTNLYQMTWPRLTITTRCEPDLVTNTSLDSITKSPFKKFIKKYLEPISCPKIKWGIKKTPVASVPIITIEEPLAPGVISNGVVIDEIALSRSIKKLISRITIGGKYFIVSIPNDKVYSRVISFPKTLTKAKFEEAVKLATDFQIPFKQEDVYLDWEKTNATKTNEVILVAAPKNVIDIYLDILGSADIKTVAIEFPAMGILRAIDIKGEDAQLIVLEHNSSITVYIVQNRTLRFSRTLPLALFNNKKALEEELSKIKMFYETENEQAVSELDWNHAELLPSIPQNADIEHREHEWISVIGTAIRGQLPRSADSMLSLMAVGTEEAYESQRITSFITFIRNSVVALSSLFCFLFLCGWIFMIVLDTNSSKQSTIISQKLLTPQILEVEKNTVKFNSLIDTTSNIVKKTPVWSAFIENLLPAISEGITITTLNITSAEDPIRLTGIAKTRQNLIAFKKSIENAGYINVDLPLTRLEQKGDIPFGISFKLRDSQSVYFK